MGHVAISAGYYLMSKLDMFLFAEFAPGELFDVESVDVKDGILRPARLPRSRCFLWRDPKKNHDLILFIGEAQPPSGKRAFCHALIQFIRQFDVERVVTFAATTTEMHPDHISRVYGAATDEELLKELTGHGVNILQEGQVGGLNGVVLGEAANAGLRGACLLGETPQLFSQIPFPGASLAVLKTFSALAEIEIDLDELIEQADNLGQKLGEVLAKLEVAMKGMQKVEEEDDVSESEFAPEAEVETDLEEQRIEDLFQQAQSDRSKAFELKRELDRLNVFHDYENRFLDLFHDPEA